MDLTTDVVVARFRYIILYCMKRMQRNEHNVKEKIQSLLSYMQRMS
jgi:hypothetical protein